MTTPMPLASRGGVSRMFRSEPCLNVEIPNLVTLTDGTTAQVKAVAVTVVDGHLGEVVYTVEKQNGAWAEVTARDVRPQGSR